MIAEWMGLTVVGDGRGVRLSEGGAGPGTKYLNLTGRCVGGEQNYYLGVYVEGAGQSSSAQLYDFEPH